MAVCSNARCFRPKPSDLGRCLTCNSLVTNTLVKQRYEIKQTIGRGGFGTTYLTKDRDRFNESCVLKELNLPSKDLFDSEFDNDLDTAERLFKREAQVLLNLQHPGIPKLHAYFHEKNYSYLVQDFIPGFTLAEEVENNKRTFDEQEARTLLMELADILEYLHNQTPSIIHRDIKPQNLMRHARGKLLLIDFGAVCQAATPSKRTLIGSPGYSPPEQIAGHPVPQSDLYAAGATILRLLTGLHPSQLFNSKMRKFEWENSTQISPRFSVLLKQLVAQDFLQRTPSATELKHQLLEISDEKPNKEVKAINLEPYELLTALHQERDTQDFQVTMESNPLLKDPQQFNTARLADEVGNLEPMSILHLLQRFYTERFTGELICSKGLISKTIYFEDGSIIFANSSLSSERLGEMLIRIGRISISEYEQAANLMRIKKLRFGSALMEIDCITPAELRPFIVTQIANIIYSLFEWNSGQYGIKATQPQAEAIKIPVSTADIIFEGLRRMENTDMIKTWLGDFTRKVISTDDPWMLYRVVKLQPKEAFIVSRLDSVMSIEEILSIGGLLETETLKTLCGLLAIGILQWADENKPSYRDITIANVLIGPAVFPNTFDIHSATQFCYEVENLLKLINTSNYYEMLSLSPDANEEEIRERYILLAKKFHPDRNIQLVNYNLNLNKELEKLFQYISEAYLTLSNRRSRTKYNNSLLRKSVASSEDLNKSLANNKTLQKPSPPTKEINKLVEDAPKPTVQSIAELPTLEATPASALIVNTKDDSAGQTWLKKGLSYYNDGQYEHASRAFWAATMVEPNNSEFHSYLARCLAMLSGCADEAEKEFTKAIELNPNNADYYVQLGLFYQKINLLKESEKMFDKALMICPSHFVALRAKQS
ncbi:MAG: DnaJ domain-containing protein [Acidobacteria bacterium]|nr:DnaJ domain-containing protein [Acidobacteriota bacterium]